MAPARIPPEVKWYSREVKARSEAVRAADEGRSVEDETLEVIRGLVGELDDDSLAHHTTQVAMARISGASLPANEPPIPTNVFEEACWAWLNLESDPGWLSRLEEAFEEGSAVEVESVQTQQIRLWAQAMEAFEHGDVKTSRRLWKQAMRISGSFGTEAHPTIAWTYAATFSRTT